MSRRRRWMLNSLRRARTMGVGGVLAGFATIIALIALGALLAQLHVLDLDAQGALSHLAFHIASPALMVSLLAGADAHQVLWANPVASAAAFAVSAGLHLLASRLAFRHGLAHMTVGTPSAAYVTVGSPIGLVLLLAGLRIPALVTDPLQLVAGMAVPATLIADDNSLCPGSRPGAGGGAQASSP